jgi:hypothetical protein
MGQLFNQAAGYLEQDIMIVDERHERLLCESLNELVAKAIEAMPNPEAGMQIRDAVLEFHKVWQRIQGSEWFAEEASEAFRILKEEAAVDRARPLHWDTLEDALASIRGHIVDLRGIIRTPLRSKLATVSEVWAAFLLGECVDQGLRPPGVLHHVFQQVTNPEWWAFARKYPSAKRQRPDPFGEREPGTPSRPCRYRLAVRTCRPGELPPPVGWAETINGLWQNLRIQTELPKCLFLLAGRRQLLGLPGVVTRLKTAAREGLSELCKSPIASNNTCAVQQQREQQDEIESGQLLASDENPIQPGPQASEEETLPPTTSNNHPSNSSRPDLSRMAVAIEYDKKWHIFRKREESWVYVRLLKKLKGGLRAKFLKKFAETGGLMEVRDAFQLAGEGEIPRGMMARRCKKK